VYCEIESIDEIGFEDVWDISMLGEEKFLSGEPNFIAQNIVVHNCHPAGIVVSPLPLSQICPLHFTQDIVETLDEDQASEKTIATQYTMSDVESLGLIKFDVLGLSTKTAISWACDTIRDNHGITLDMGRLPLNDKETLDLIRSGKTVGCFQLEGRGMQNAIKTLGVKSFDDLVALIAMYRPGPMDYIPEMGRRKRGQSPITYVHPLMKSITERTFGILVYQEQIMKAFMVLADLTASDGYMFVQGCAKKKQKQLDEALDKFTAKTKSRAIAEDVIKQLVDDMRKFGGYAFNKTLYFSEGIATSEGEYTIEELFSLKNQRELPKVYSPTGEFVDIVDVYDHGFVPMYKVTLSDGSVHRCTGHHKFASTQGTLPLYEIIERDAQLIVNRRVRDASKKSVDMSSLSGRTAIPTKAMGSQAHMRAVENPQIEALFRTKQREFSEVLGKNAGEPRCNGIVQPENGACSFVVNNGQRKREESSFFSDVSGKQRSSGSLSQQSCGDRPKNIIASRDSIRENRQIENVAGGTSRRVLREMHPTSDVADGLEIETRNTPQGNPYPVRISLLSSSKEYKVLYEVSTPPSGFYEPRQEDHRGVRRPTSFSRRLWETSKGHSRRRFCTERSNDGAGLSDHSDVIRNMGSAIVSIQVCRDGDAYFSDSQRKEQAEACVDWENVRIVDIETIGFCQGYDLEVASNDHLYCLSSGVINSNSHSVSYAYECWKTAYLKAHYPTEFFEARLSVENIRRIFDLVDDYETDAVENFGFKIDPPELNKSKIRYTIVGDRHIRKPLLVKGIGWKAANEIADKQPYRGKDLLFDFAMKVGNAVNSKVMESMWEAGLWGKMKKTELLRLFDQIKKDKKATRGRPTDDLFE
jgi:hypothetical protein